MALTSDSVVSPADERSDETKKIEIMKLSNTLCSSSAVEKLGLATYCKWGVNRCLGPGCDVIGRQVGIRSKA